MELPEEVGWGLNATAVNGASCRILFYLTLRLSLRVCTRHMARVRYLSNCPAQFNSKVKEKFYYKQIKTVVLLVQAFCPRNSDPLWVRSP